MRLLASLLVLFVPVGALAADFVPLAPIPNLTENVSPTSSGIATFLGNLYIWLIGAAAILAVIMIIWGGLEIATKESVARHANGVARIRAALFGLLLVLSPVLVFTVINPQILNLNVNFQALETGWSNYKNTDPVITPDSTGGYTETLVCGSSTDCSSVIKNCSSGNLPQCVKGGGGSAYTPGSNGAPAGSCNTGDTASCYHGSVAPSAGML